MNIPHKKEFSLELFGRTLSFTISDLASQANASVVGQYGDTVVLVTAVMGNQDRATDFFPLTVDYEERFYAAGKVLGSRFVRREGRPSDLAVLSGRLIDRSIRPLFDQRLRREVQVVVTILSFDEENDPDFVALATASLALAISDIPWKGPIAGMRLMKADGSFIYNPTYQQSETVLEKNGSFEAFFSGTAGRINMIELLGNEASEADVEEGFVNAHEEIKKLITFQESIIKEIGKPKTSIVLTQEDPALVDAVRSFAHDRLQEALYVVDKGERAKGLEVLRAELDEHLGGAGFEDLSGVEGVWENLVNEIVHINILEKEKRPDGRAMDQVRPLFASVGLFKRLHGSAFFSRGQTQSLAVTTLAAPGHEQLVETMESSTKRRFMLHYNFPPYSTGEVKRMGSPGRREIGHGALAEKALRPMIPSQEEFPYTIRLVSEIVSSNGSSSMASVCAGTLSLMDAGVPIKKPVAGIAMGLVTHQGYNEVATSDAFKIMTDIQGPEDHYGDMDLKVAGTRDGITAVQMDVKMEGLTRDMFVAALPMAQKARFEILDVIAGAIEAPRKELSEYAPVILTAMVKPEQIGMVIGSGGKTINGLIEEFGLESIDINEDGSVFVSASSAQKAQRAIEAIENMTKEYGVGDVVEGPIIKLLDFGAIVDLGGGQDGMIHVSEIKNGFVDKVSDFLKEGQVVKAKVVKMDNGRISLSIKALGEQKA